MNTTTKPRDRHERVYCMSDPLEKLTDEAIISHIPFGSRVLDLGCGDGRLLTQLRDKHGASIQGIELDCRREDRQGSAHDPRTDRGSRLGRQPASRVGTVRAGKRATRRAARGCIVAGAEPENCNPCHKRESPPAMSLELPNYDCLCAGIIVADFVCAPITAVPAAGGLAMTDAISPAIGG